MRKGKVTAAVVLVTALSLIGQTCNAEVYGLLNKKNDTWTISELTTYSPSGKAVNLASMSPVHYDTKTHSCPFSLWGKSDGESSCEDYASDFRSSRVKWPLTILANTVLLPFVIPSCGILVDKESYFDDELFAATVNKAVDSDGVKDALALYNDYYASATNIESDIYQTYSSVQAKYLETTKVNTTVEDLTGLWTNQELPVISLTPTVLDKLDKNVPAGTPEEFKKAVLTAKNSLKEKAEEYRNKLSAQAIQFTINHPKTASIDGFTVESDYPSQVNVKNINKVQTKYIIKSKTFDGVYPAYSNSDDKLHVEFDGKTLTCTNKSDKFLQIVSIATYYNSEVNNFTGATIDLPPQTHKKLYPLEGATNIRKEAKFLDVDKAKATRTDFTFGFAVRYRSVDQNIDNTLYKTPKYNLFKVLREAQIRS